MTKAEIFKKYSIDESHAEWNPMVDNWISVEVYREMHDGELPPPDDLSMQYVLDFLDACNEGSKMRELMADPKKNAGSLYLTAKRMIYRFSDYLPGQPKDPELKS